MTAFNPSANAPIAATNIPIGLDAIATNKALADAVAPAMPVLAIFMEILTAGPKVCIPPKALLMLCS